MARSEHLSLHYPDPELADELVRIREWRLDDLECVRQASTDAGIAAATSIPEVFTPEKGRASRVHDHARRG